MDLSSRKVKTVGDVNEFLVDFRICVECWIDPPAGAKNFMRSTRKLYEKLVKAVDPESQDRNISPEIPAAKRISAAAVAIIDQIKKESVDIGLVK